MTDQDATNLSTTLDRLLEQATSKDESFRAMTQAAGLDPLRDFVGATLRNVDFRGEDLRGFNFSGADLTGADFRKANVEGVDFQRANLTGAIGLPGGPEAPLPRVSANLLGGLVETLAAAPYSGVADLLVLADELHMEADELFPVCDALQLLGLAEMEGGNVQLTETGRLFASLELVQRKQLFHQLLVSHVPLAAHIRNVLHQRANHVAPKSRFFDELEDRMSPEDTEETLRAVIAWGRYAELFEYDEDSGTFSLPQRLDSL